MQMTPSMNLSITGGIIVFLLIGFIFPSAVANIKTYPDDGIWEDTFDDSSTVTCFNNVEVKNGEIVLSQGESEQIKYNFLSQDSHLAYNYSSFFFFPMLFSPKIHTIIERLYEGRDPSYLKEIDHEYTNASSKQFQKYAIQHFRFKIDINNESLNEIHLQWNGKTDDNTYIYFYYWNSSRFLFGGWEELAHNRSMTGKDTEITTDISGENVKYAVDKNNYIDISIVISFPGGVSPIYYKKCTLSTDFIEILVQTKVGYSLAGGYAQTKDPIDPLSISTKYNKFYWELLAWGDYEPEGTQAIYQVLYYENQTSRWTLVENTTLPGNGKGFTTSPVYLNNLSKREYQDKYNRLKIRVTPKTNNPSVSPHIFSWAVTWQNGTFWQDSFNTEYRIDQRTRVAIESGSLSISLFRDEWPLFGFDSGNTRASYGKGPTTSSTYWFSYESVGGGYRNPVISNGKVYILSNKRSLHVYNVKIPAGSEEGYLQKNVLSLIFNYDVVNSPALSEDLVIVATGQQAKGGYENHIYAYQKDNLAMSWDFDYLKEKGEKICYTTSPIIAGNTIFISTWGGDNDTYLLEKNRYKNNKLIALDLDSGAFKWEYLLSAASFSTPAVTSDLVIVGCSSSNNDSVFALSHNGEKLWSRNVGSIGHASPVIYGNTVFVTCEQENLLEGEANTTIRAINLSNGRILWNFTVSEFLLSYNKDLCDSTPAVYNNVLYVASADGSLYAINTGDGSIRWVQKIYSWIPVVSPDVLISSPAYANNLIYIGTPNGKIIGINATNGKERWSKNSAYSAPVLGSPIVSNGLVFIADEKGYLYSIGTFADSTIADTGFIISNPIRLPQDLSWKSFHVDVSYNKSFSNINFKLLDKDKNVLRDLTNGTILSDTTLPSTLRLRADFATNNITADNPRLLRWEITFTPKDSTPPYLYPSTTPPFNGSVVPKFVIKVKDNQTGLLVNSATYTIRYIINNTLITNTFSALCTGVNGTTLVQNITANLSKISNFNNITLLLFIKFSMKDLAENEVTKSFSIDTKSPYLYPSTTPPFNGSVVPKFVIKVKDNQTGLLVNSAAYTLRYIINNKTYTNTFSALCTGVNGTTLVQNITANLSKISNFNSITSLVFINFSIKDLAENEVTKSFSIDTKSPYLYPSTTPPFNGSVVPKFVIKVKDNQTGLLVNSAAYTLRYIINNKTYTNTFSALCTGVNGTTLVQNITANLSKISIFNNISSLVSINFSIKDLAGNTATKIFIIPDTDITPPSSYIINLSMKPRYNASARFISINAVSFDNGTSISGIQQVILYYRYSSTGTFTGAWTYFANSTQKSPQWKFNFTSDQNQHGGYFELCTVAIDKAGNTETFPTKGDISFLYDWMVPNLPSVPGGILWLKEPSISSVGFEDDFRLDTIQYHPNLDNSWTTIVTDVNISTYNEPWSLKEEYWELMNEGEVYYLYFKINDTLGNTLLVTSDNQAMTFRKDTTVPIVTIDIPSLETETSSSYNFSVVALVNDQDGSGINEVSLYYRFSEDQSNWSSWKPYGNALYLPPFEWNYTAQNGDGYYEFKINVIDIAGNTIDSKIFHVRIFPFTIPVTLLMVMIILVIVLCLLSAIIFIKYKKTKVK